MNTTNFENQHFVKFLYFMGYRYPGMILQRYIETSRNEKNIQNVVINQNRPLRNKLFFIHMFRIFYCFFIFLMIMIEPCYLWLQILTIETANKKITYACFSIIPAIEYIIGIVYFSTHHFDDKMTIIRNSTLTYFNQERKILSFIFFWLCFCLICSGIIMYVDLFVVYIGMEYNELLENVPQIIIVLMQIGSWLYGRLAILLNLTIFLTIFTSHVKDLDNCVTIMKNRNSFEFDYIKISDICYEILKIKGGLEMSIKYLQPMYTIPTCIGTVGIGAFVNLAIYDIPNVFTIISVIVYLFIQAFCLFLMYFVNEQKEILKKIIQSPKFTHSFLQAIRKKYQKYAYRVLSSTLTAKESIITYSEITNASVDWLILNSILSEEWETFRLFGLTFNDGAAIQKAFAFSALLVRMNTVAYNMLV